MAPPLIGVSSYLEVARWGAWAEPAALLSVTYLTGVRAAGGIPVLLPPGHPADADVTGVAGAAEVVPSAVAAEGAIARLDGLLLTGGADVDPAAYSAAPHGETVDVQPGRDRWELDLLAAAMAAGLPVLGVCRGAQVLAVAMGGTLHQHLPDVVGHHRHRVRAGEFGPMPVRLDVRQLPGTALGEQVTVRCHHHQAVDLPGSGLVATGWAADGTVEAVAAPAAEFVVGVQWHPEEDPADTRLFAAFVAAARRRAAR